MAELTKVLEPFENESCGGYREYISDGDYEELFIGDAIEEALKGYGIEQYEHIVTHAFDSPGVDVSILSVSYIDLEGNLRLRSFELISC